MFRRFPIYMEIVFLSFRVCPEIANRLNITARQYGKVVLPDANTGQGPDTLARRLSRCKEGMARVFAIMVQILLSITRVAVQC
jgi:hypothetical protein